MHATTAHPSLDEIGAFLPPLAHTSARAAFDALAAADVDADAALGWALHVGEIALQGALDAGVDLIEALVAWLYDSGAIEGLGRISSMLRDGVEMGIHLSVNALKALTPADLAKIIGLALIATLAPNLALLNAPPLIEAGMTLALKLWHMP